MGKNTPSRTSRTAREKDADDFRLPSLSDRMAMAAQVPNPLFKTSTEAPENTSPSSSSRAANVGPSESTEVVHNIPLDLIDPNPYNARHIYREERVKEMALSLAAHGQQQPGLSTIRNGRYILASGHYRLAGAKLAALPTLKLFIREGMTDRELFEMSYLENKERESQSALDNAFSWAHALKNKLYSSETELAEINGISLPTINKTLAILQLPEEVLNEIKLAPNDFGISVLYELFVYSKRASLEQTLAVTRQVRIGEISRRDIEAARKAIENPKERKQREGSRQYRIPTSLGQVGTIKEWDSGRVLLEVKIDDPTKRAALVAELCQKFGVGQGDTIP